MTPLELRLIIVGIILCVVSPVVLWVIVKLVMKKLGKEKEHER
jgi:Mn2+/Fe2+ NRAMP family transporter